MFLKINKTSHYPTYTTKTTPWFYLKKKTYPKFLLKKKHLQKKEFHCTRKARVMMLVLFYYVDIYYFIVKFVGWIVK